MISFLAAATVMGIAPASAVTHLDSFASALHSAQGLTAELNLTVIGGGKRSMTIALAKPNQARIETPERLIVADGQNLTVYMKNQDMFYVKEQTEAELRTFFDEPSLATWLGFFEKDSMKGFVGAKNGKDRKLGGKNFRTVTASADKTGETNVTFFIDPSDRMAKRVMFDQDSFGKKTKSILTVSKVKLGAPDIGLFAFNAPDGVEQVEEADLMAGVWLYDFDEGLRAAEVTGKLMMVDFYTTWCGPCKQMDKETFATDRFKKKAEDFVLVKLDAEVEVGLAKKYDVKAYPTVKFIDKNGHKVHEFVGYGGIDHVLGEMDKAKSAK
jgi:thiol-disulfide isomerase/thioredoxin